MNANDIIINETENTTITVNGHTISTGDYPFAFINKLLNDGTICYSNTTQREYIYNRVYENGAVGRVSKASKLISNIFDGIRIPAVFLWYNTDTNTLNIHDGKQRTLTMYYFCHPELEVDIGVSKIEWNNLSLDEQKRFMGTKVTLQIRIGNTEEEEENFYEINSHAENLTEYEKLRGCLFGRFLTEFENHLLDLHKDYDHVEDTLKARGVESYEYLCHFFGVHLMTEADAIAKHRKIRGYIKPLRRNAFNESDFDCDHLLAVMNSLRKSNFHCENALNLSYFIVKDLQLSAEEEATTLANYARDGRKEVGGDITSWDIENHSLYIRALFDTSRSEEDRHLDPLRSFAKDKRIKDDLINLDGPVCRHKNPDGTRCTCRNVSQLTVDHIKPWSLGGRTNLANAQLLCDKHNSAKGNSDKEN